MNIEEVIKQRKDQLSVETPPADLWDGIRKEWKSKKGYSFRWKVAAILFTATSISLLLHNIFLQNHMDQLATLGDISEEYHTIENSYISQINDLESGLNLKEVKSQDDFSWIFYELNTLDEINKLYRQDIGKINEDQLVGVLIDCYEKKIRLLKKLELEIRRTNKFKNDEETNTNSISL